MPGDTVREITLIMYKPEEVRSYGGIKQIMNRQSASEVASDGIKHTVTFDLKDRMQDYFSLFKLLEDWKIEYVVRGVTIAAKYAREVHQHLEHFQEVLGNPPLRHRCKTGFGCKFLDTKFKTWYKLGHLDADGNWIVHKSDLQKQLEAELAKGIDLACPIFDENWYRTALDKLPDRIDPRTNELWDYRYDADGKPIGIMPVSYLK